MNLVEKDKENAQFAEKLKLNLREIKYTSLMINDSHLKQFLYMNTHGAEQTGKLGSVTLGSQLRKYFRKSSDHIKNIYIYV